MCWRPHKNKFIFRIHDSLWTLFCFARWKFIPNWRLCAYAGRCLQPLCWRRLVQLGFQIVGNPPDSIGAWYTGDETTRHFNTFQYQRAKRDTFNIIEGNICALASLVERGTAQRVSPRRTQSSSLSALGQSIPNIWQLRFPLPLPNPVVNEIHFQIITF